MLACVAGSMLWKNNWQVQSFRTLDSHRTTVKTSELAHRKTLNKYSFSFKIPISDFHEQNHLFHLNSIHCKHRHQCHNYRRGTITKTQFSLPCKILTELRNSPSKNIPFFQNADSRFLMNTVIHSILTSFTSCKYRHQYYIDIIQIFELRIF